LHHAKDKIDLCRGQLTTNKKKDDKHQMAFYSYSAQCLTNQTMLQAARRLPTHVTMPYICHYAASLCTLATTSRLVLEPPVDE
jgi:hypothetical protein